MTNIKFKEYQEQIKDLPIGENCTGVKTLEIFQGKWNIRVLFELVRCDSIRFGDLKKTSGWNNKYNAYFHTEGFRKQGISSQNSI
ncbi:DNA-binding HxlR family transcriptional regulator [Clostridium beijerinckii]|uniref:hypothetical protein n=1 Tax=Clostridium beijerinckii TaxID=1520 RepID=UPI001D89ACB8|nr:hypothetical protein [Clostridium beijerinckii]NRX26526.1 DNA-binding HxlR family transcriptional regulator [Clostridium beijerinckii]